MAKRQGDIGIGQRMAEECNRVFATQSIAAKRLGFEKKSIQYWKSGSTPSGLALARLHYCGGDVIYVLTGQRRAEDGK